MPPLALMFCQKASAPPRELLNGTGPVCEYTPPMTISLPAPTFDDFAVVLDDCAVVLDVFALDEPPPQAPATTARTESIAVARNLRDVPTVGCFIAYLRDWSVGGGNG